MRRATHIGSIIRAGRKKLKITSEALAKKVGIDRTYISKIENYNLIPSWEILVAIGRELKLEGLPTVYFEQKHPEIIYDKGNKTYKETVYTEDKRTALRNEMFNFISQTTAKHYSTIKTFVTNILNKYNPAEITNDTLIAKASRLIKKMAKDYQSYQKLYNQTENEIIRLINP